VRTALRPHLPSLRPHFITNTKYLFVNPWNLRTRNTDPKSPILPTRDRRFFHFPDIFPKKVMKSGKTAPLIQRLKMVKKLKFLILSSDEAGTPNFWKTQKNEKLFFKHPRRTKWLQKNYKIVTFGHYFTYFISILIFFFIYHFLTVRSSDLTFALLNFWRFFFF